MNRITIICEDSFDGIMTAVYDGWVFMKKGNQVSIWAGDNCEYNLFSEYITIETDTDKSISVSKSIKNKISKKAFLWVYTAAMHFDGGKGTTILGFLKVGYEAGKRVTEYLDNPYVMRMMELNRKVTNEAHRFKEFIRFSEIRKGILYSEIAPKCDVITLVAPHFEDRFPMENWVIYDKKREKSAVHPAGGRWFVMSGQKFNMSELKNNGNIKFAIDTHIDNFEELWKVFFDAVAVESRINPQCRRNMLPLWYRENMLEFEDEIK